MESNSWPFCYTSTYSFERAFDILRVMDNNYKYCPSFEEWRRAEEMCEFLKSFYDTTNLISSSSYLTSNLYFMQVWKIQCMLDQNQFDEEDVIRDMAKRIMEKFDKYLKDYSVVLAFGTILDPRLKLDFLNFCYRKLDLSTSGDKVRIVREKFEKLYREYSYNLSAPSASQSSSESSTLNIYRSSTLLENAQMLICTRNWLHGFVLNPEGEDNYKTLGDKTFVMHQEDEDVDEE